MPARPALKAPARPARGAPSEPLALWEAGTLLGMAERALEGALSAGADEAEVFALQSRSVGVDIERTMVEGSSVGGDFGLGIRVLRQGRMGFGFAAQLSEAKAAIEGALQAARHVPRERARFAEAAPASRPTRPDSRILALGPEALADRAQVLIEGAKAASARIEVSGGGIGASSDAWALANSRGLRHEEVSAAIGASASVLLRDGTISTGTDHQTSVADDIHLEEIGRRAARLAVESRRPRAITSGAYDLILKPDAMQELLETCCIRGLVAENVRRAESPFVGKVGKRIAAKGFSLHDDGLLPQGLGTAARDDEGLPSQRTTLIEDGVLKGLLHDLRSAARDNASSTASAQRADRGEGERSHLAQPRAAGRNFVVDGPRKPLEDLIGETRRGLIVHDVIGAHTANMVTGDFHVNSPILFLVERGEITGPAKSVLLSGSMLRWLRDITGLSAEAVDIGAYGSPASLRLPWVRVKGATVHA